ncbi:MAG: sulfatase-like hydrolase/transferase, partial [Candidatus Aminicenantes bacterium]|nr:sulfatase-like hydrolase/transferase [Candidatus Aminicenantes bacterium]
MKKSWLPGYVKYLFSVYFVGIAFFTVFRILLLLTNLNQLHALPAGKFGLIFKAFIMGFRFDTVISGYILSLPLLILFIISLLLVENKWVYRSLTIYIVLLYSAAFFICAVDIPYYRFFNSRFSAIVFNWLDAPGFLFKMTIEDTVNWLYMSGFLAASILFGFIPVYFEKKFLPAPPPAPGSFRKRYFLKISGFFLLSLVLLFIGMRGRLAKKSPIRVGTAYFSNYSFPNQLGLNPVFTFVRSSIDRVSQKKQDRDFMDSETAVKQVQKYLKIDPVENREYDSPIARKIETEGAPLRANVIVVIMESMSAEKMSRCGNPHNLTPNLDKVAEKSLTFDNIYTSGVHTSNGIFSTLFALTAIFKQHPLKTVPILTYAGLPNILKNQGYRTIFFCTHDDQFDNMGGFLRANGFEQIISKTHYSSDRVLSTLGVPDDYMFEFSISRLNELSGSDQPFLAVFMTCSDHPPYIIPENTPFKPHSRVKSRQSVEYADWAIGKFLKLASRQRWFANTLFVFIADHGANMNTVYDMPLSYFHTPFIIHSPSLIREPRSIAQIGGQIDVFPTIMGILNIPYVNNTMGIDLLKESRPFIYFYGDDKMGCLNEEYFLVIRDKGNESLYAYRTRDTKSYLDSKKQLAASMKDYFFSMMQTTKWLIRNGKVGVQRPL